MDPARLGLADPRFGRGLPGRSSGPVRQPGEARFDAPEPYPYYDGWSRPASLLQPQACRGKPTPQQAPFTIQDAAYSRQDVPYAKRDAPPCGQLGPACSQQEPPYGNQGPFYGQREAPCASDEPQAPQTPEKSMLRSLTAYIRSPQQLLAVKLGNQRQTKQQISAKNFFRRNEAQSIVDIFRNRLEKALDEELEDFSVTNYHGDLIRKGIFKVRVGEECYVHLLCVRLARGEPWVCRYAPYKAESDFLDQAEEEYDSLPSRTHCGEKMAMNGCTTLESCALM